MMPSQPPELFPERPVQSYDSDRGLSYATRRAITLTVLAVVIGGAAYWGIRHSQPSGATGEIPTLKPAETTYKQKPEQPGGIDIPHQDMEVYQQLDGLKTATDKPSAEHMLPPPEQPIASSMVQVPVQQLAPETMPQEAQASTIESLMEPVAPPSAPVATTVTPTDEASAPAAAPVLPTAPTELKASNIPAMTDNAPTALTPNLPSPASPPTSASSATPPTQIPVARTTDNQSQPASSAPESLVAGVAPSASPAIAEKPTAAPSSPAPTASMTASPALAKGMAVVQLAAIPKSESAAQQALQKLQGQYANQLKDARLRIVRADLGAKGLYYRIQTQPLPAGDADRLCSAIKSLNAGCLLVRP